ncbi:MAG: hypothetical protein GXO63_02730 [Candidatus Micrarchaeota archaeon]|nr:hypothetical protein [Candidatus Micrarchaeota archaeon]
MQTVEGVLNSMFEMAKPFVPNLLVSILIIIIGFIIGKILGSIVKEILVKMNVDRYFRRKEILAIEPSALGSLATRWVIYLFFINQAVAILQLTELTIFVEKIIEYLTQTVFAVATILIGYLVASYLKEKMITTESVYSEIMANTVFLIVFYISIAIGLKFIQAVETTIIDNLLLILVGSAGLGFAIAIGLGLKDVVSEVAKEYLREARKKHRKRKR